jgi:glycosyltransferase involved in cell wall biosynthesis
MAITAEHMPDARLAWAGPFAPAAFETHLRNLPGWAKVDYRGKLDRPDVAELLGRSRAGLVVFQPAPNHMEAQPNKLFEYMAAGLPVIASDFPLWRNIVTGAGCGLLVDPLSPPAIANAITWILDHPDEAEAMGRRGQHAVSSTYAWDREAEKLVALYTKLLTSSPR